MPSEDPGRGVGPRDRDGRDGTERDREPSDRRDRSERQSRWGAASANGGTADLGPGSLDAEQPGGPGTDANRPPPPSAIDHAFHVTEVRTEGDRVYYFGHALVGDDLEAAITPAFRNAGYAISHVERAGEDVVVARPAASGVDGVPWTHLLLFVLTIGSTLIAGSMWFFVNPIQEPTQIWKGWPFSVGIMTVLGVHEMGHYVMTRRHDVDATLPYFIPVPTLIGTMGAVIRMKGSMPDRKALFDIGVAGPIAGLIATVAVTVVGLYLDPVTAPAELATSENAQEIAIGFPPLLHFLSWLTGQPLYYDDPLTTVHPVVVAGWVGMFVTFLNLIPVGQLDGGHVVRAIAPEYQATIAAVVPGVLYALAGYLLLVRDLAPRNVTLWIVWGTIALALAFVGPATPTDDSTDIGWKRTVVGIATFVVGMTCFAPVPIAIVS
ncbi:peptidase M50 [Salinarchaeum sp. Harcht-Bsk1]|uniref:site-2 protease family protein n=1 Tax=Salinarchaeum sp. Harcht-Bsk1 TaxID=1333523 RepID=UPI00034233AE|nr:site-2 protease family protein [Salinarchaeum sp. Harcht-Bsk1]AGN00567.1 peptidase M50 [Salinarchaeum sp. Harcht-Bsk1]